MNRNSLLSVLLACAACFATRTNLSAQAVAASLKDARSALDIARMSGLLYNWKSADPQINIEHSNVILTKADILELQELHRKALLAGK